MPRYVGVNSCIRSRISLCLLTLVACSCWCPAHLHRCAASCAVVGRSFVTSSLHRDATRCERLCVCPCVCLCVCVCPCVCVCVCVSVCVCLSCACVCSLSLSRSLFRSLSRSLVEHLHATAATCGVAVCQAMPAHPDAAAPVALPVDWARAARHPRARLLRAQVTLPFVHARADIRARCACACVCVCVCVRVRACVLVLAREQTCACVCVCVSCTCAPAHDVCACVCAWEWEFKSARV